MEEFKRIGYKNTFSAWALLIGSVFSFVIMISALILKPNDFHYVFIFSLLSAVVFFVSFIVEKRRPEVVVFLSNNSVRILKGFKWETILFDDIDGVDYKLNVHQEIQAMLLGIGSLIIVTKTNKLVVRNIENVRDCYEKIVEALREYTNIEKQG